MVKWGGSGSGIAQLSRTIEQPDWFGVLEPSLNICTKLGYFAEKFVKVFYNFSDINSDIEKQKKILITRIKLICVFFKLDLKRGLFKIEISVIFFSSNLESNIIFVFSRIYSYVFGTKNIEIASRKFSVEGEEVWSQNLLLHPRSANFTNRQIFGGRKLERNNKNIPPKKC